MAKAFRYFKSNSGFTLIELIVVMVIVGVIASIALPQYAAFREKAIVAEAAVAIGMIRKAEELCRIERGSYVLCNNAAQIRANLNLTLSEVNWYYIATAPTNNSYLRIYAIRQAAAGPPYAGRFFIFDIFPSFTRWGPLITSPSGHPLRPRNENGS